MDSYEFRVVALSVIAAVSLYVLVYDSWKLRINKKLLLKLLRRRPTTEMELVCKGVSPKYLHGLLKKMKKKKKIVEIERRSYQGVRYRTYALPKTSKGPGGNS